MIAAARIGSIDVVDPLVQAGAKVNARNKMGQTAVMFAAFRADHSMIRRLHYHGADLRMKDRMDRTPY